MVYLEEGAYYHLVLDAERTFPYECCGFLLGTEDETGRQVLGIRVVDNAREGDKRRRFEISAKDYQEAEAYALENNIQLLGVYHSHPNHPAIPSEHDRVAAQPYFSYAILSIQEGKFHHLRCWRLNENFQFEEESITWPSLATQTEEQKNN